MTTRKFTPNATRGPRLNPGEISVNPPEDLGVDVPAPAIKKFLPLIMGGCMLGLVGIMFSSGIRNLSPYMLMMPLMMVMMLGGSMGGGAGGGKKVPEINADRKEYLRYLAGLRSRVTTSAGAQVAFFGYHAANPNDLLSIIGTPRQWSRPANSDFYAATRIGIGDQPAVDRLLKPSVGGELAGPGAAPQPYLEPVSHMWAVKFLRTHGLIHDCPKLLQLRTFPTIAIGGDPSGAAGLLTAMICHLAVFHSPDQLQVRVLTDDPEDPDWSWIKWLPHVAHPTATDAAGPTRMIYTGAEGLSDLAARGPHTPDGGPGGPHVVVVDLTGGRAGFPPDGRAGVTVITLGNHRDSAYRIRVADDATADDRLPGQQFRLVTSTTDRVSPEQATRIARKLAGWSITGTIVDKKARVQKKKVATEWHQLVGATSAEEVLPERWRMYPDADRDRLRIPFGHELKTGEVMYLDIKEGAEFGSGPHGMLIGTTGSGKSEFLRTLILSLAATHHPDQINLLLTDFKGGSTFLGMEKLPHTTAVITNMAEEAELVSRMGEVLTGELDRRQAILRQAGIQVGASGALSGVAEYEKYRERGADLAPLPTLFVVVDEFAELLQSHPDFLALFDRICRVGRSLRVHLLLATQSLQTGGARIDKLEPNLTYRIALRTTSSAESRAVIGTPEAQYITNKESGVGFLRVGMEDPVKFSTLYTGGSYVPPAAAHTNGQAGASDAAVTAQVLRPQLFTAATIPGPPIVTQSAPPSAPPVSAGATSSESPHQSLRELVINQLSTMASRAYKIWLPPLTDPTPLEELIANDDRHQLRFALGIMDEPRQHRQAVWGVDVSGASGNIAIGGAPQTGKSTLLQTLILSAAATHSPRDVQFYCIDLGGGGLTYLQDLPHVGAVVTRSEPDRVMRVLAEVRAVLRQRETDFKQYRVGSMAAYRKMREDPNHPAAADPFGDVFLVIDGWPAVVSEFPDIEPLVQNLAGQGLSFGVHVIITTPRWTELKSRVRDYLGTKIEFRLGDVSDTQIDRITRDIPAGRPGRAISLEKHHLMIGVPRLDGVHGDENLVEAITAATEQIASENTEFAPQVRVLPDRIDLADLDPNPPGPESDYTTRWTIPIGLRETDLSVAYAPMAENPHLLIFGAAKSGKTRIAHAVARAICARNSPAQVRFMLADFRSGLLGAVPDSHLLKAGAINRNSTSLDESIKALAVNLKKRLPPADLTSAQLRARSWWTGPDVVLLVDDWHMIMAASGGMPPMGPLAPLLPAASDIGLHLIVTCQMSQAYKASMDKFVGTAFGAGSPTLFLSGEKGDFPSREIIVKKRPPGQAFMVSPEGKEVIQAVYIDPPDDGE